MANEPTRAMYFTREITYGNIVYSNAALKKT